MVGLGPLSRTAGVGPSDHSGNQRMESPDTCSPVPKLNRLVCKLRVFFDDEHADTTLFDGLAAFRFISKCFAGRGKRRWYATGKLEHSTSWFFVLGALVLACCLQHGESDPRRGRPGWAIRPQRLNSTHFGRAHLKLVRHLHLHPHSIMLTNYLIVSCAVLLGCGFRQTSNVEETLEWRVSCTLTQVVRTNASSNVRTDRRRSFRIIRDSMARVLQSHTWRFLGARCASSCHVACAMARVGWRFRPQRQSNAHLGRAQIKMHLTPP